MGRSQIRRGVVFGLISLCWGWPAAAVGLPQGIGQLISENSVLADGSVFFAPAAAALEHPTLPIQASIVPAGVHLAVLILYAALIAWLLPHGRRAFPKLLYYVREAAAAISRTR